MLPQNYNTATLRKLYHGPGLGYSGKNYNTASTSWPGRKKNYNTALAAGWMSELLCYNYFLVQKLFRIKFGLEPDALVGGGGT